MKNRKKSLNKRLKHNMKKNVFRSNSRVQTGKRNVKTIVIVHIILQCALNKPLSSLLKVWYTNSPLYLVGLNICKFALVIVLENRTSKTFLLLDEILTCIENWVSWSSSLVHKNLDIKLTNWCLQLNFYTLYWCLFSSNFCSTWKLSKNFLVKLIP